MKRHLSVENYFLASFAVIELLNACLKESVSQSVSQSVNQAVCTTKFH